MKTEAATALIKKKLQLEFEIKASPRIIYPYLSTANGLEGWFSQKCNSNGNIFTFHWDKIIAKAKLVTKKDNQLVRFKWLDETGAKIKDDTYFEMEIQQDEITGDVALIVTDFTTDEEKEENTMLWESEIHELMHIIGS